LCSEFKEKCHEVACPFCLFYRDLAGLLEQKVIVVSFFGKSPYSSVGCKAGLIDGFPGRRVFHTSLIDDPDVDQELLVRNILLIFNRNEKILMLISKTKPIKLQYGHCMLSCLMKPFFLDIS
jgi:hypothetical protein